MGVWIRWLKDLWLGKRALGRSVERAAAAPSTMNLFTVAGGKILLTQLIGTLTAAMDANATSVKIVAIPTGATSKDLCTAVNIASYAIGDMIGLSGGLIGAPGALQPATTGGVISDMTTPMIIQPGFIGLNLAAPGQLTGIIRWTLKYLPLDDAGMVTPA